MTGRSGKLSCVAGAGSNELTDAPAPGAQSDGIRYGPTPGTMPAPTILNVAR